MNFITKQLVVLLSLAALSTGCAAITPPQLLEARAAYATSRNGLAGKLTPTELYDAKKVLDQAEAEFATNGDTSAVRDGAYVAKRKVELADVKALTEVDRQIIADAAKQGVVVRDSQVKRSQAALADSREELKAERSASAEQMKDAQATNAAQGKELERTAEQLEAEKVARNTAEAKLAGAMKDLATIAAVKEEARGVVITLNGSVLFASGQYALLETAKTRLDQVAVALKAQNDDKRMSVEGHTDSQGGNAVNQPLSLNRARAVRDYLVSRGVEGTHITAIGLGSTRPLVDNLSAENRANNRRVEIIIQAARLSAR